ncbi:hypothetical protein [Campylobacter concisus]|uniref:hypothetical protein n=1 Tax=Campylobacter concisus TaxID=199 RepID=UPI003D203C36
MENLLDNIGDYTTEIVELASKESYALIKAAASTLYKSKVEVVSHFMHSFMDERFKIRLQDFIHEEERSSDRSKKKFYEDIDNNNINILFDLLEKARTTTYDLHAKILAKLYGRLFQNGKLDYYEHALLANINSLSDLDFMYFYNLVKNKPKSPLMTSDDCEYIAINKFIQIGILSKSGLTHLGGDGNGKLPIDFQINDFSKNLFETLELIMPSCNIQK